MTLMNTLKLLTLLLLTTGISTTSYSQADTTAQSEGEKRTMVISGGGARSAWGAGVAKALVEAGNDYTTVGGTSGGALIAPLVLLKQFSELESLYANISNKTVYNVNPFKKNGEFRKFRAGWRAIFGKPSIGDTKNLRYKVLEQMVSLDDYNQMKKENRNLYCAVTNLNEGVTEIKSNDSSGYADMLDWIWASASFPIFMAPVHKNDTYYADGGVLNSVPIMPAFHDGHKVIDVVVLNFKGAPSWKNPKDALLSIFARTMILYIDVPQECDIQLAESAEKVEEGTIMNIYYMTREEVEYMGDPLYFDSKIMTTSYNKGYDSVKNGTIEKETYMMQNGMMVKQ